MASPLIKIVQKQQFQSIDEFELELSEGRNTIGKGSFGVVKLGLHKGTNKLYALKIIDLAKVESEAQLKIIEREIELHSSLDHPHIIKIWDTLISGSIVYMIMESAERGNLFYHQNTRVKFSESEAFQYFYQCAKAVDYLHRHDIIHRDIKVCRRLLKPENLLLDHSLNLKLCDFGWSALDINMKRTTFCGTYEYMAPEMILKGKYDYRVDIWGLGVLLYELVHGYAPFRGNTLEEVAEKVKIGHYEVSPLLSEDLRQLIKAVLQFDPEKRLSLRQIFAHPWTERMKLVVNNYLKKGQVTLTSIIPLKLAKISEADLVNPATMTKKKTHRKAESAMNCPGEKKNIQINFEINNYGLVGAHSTKKLTGRCKTLTEESMKKLMNGHERKPTLVTTGNSHQSLKASKVKKASYMDSKPAPREFPRTNTELSVHAQRKKKSIDQAVNKLSRKYLEHVKVPASKRQ